MSKSDNVPAMYQTAPAGFNPMKLLRKAVSAITGETVMRLELPYKKLWFRKAHPHGRIYVKPLRITEQIAIYEAQVFLNREDQTPISSFTASISKEEAPDGQYMEKALSDAVDNALTGAGFGIQVPDASAPKGIRYYGSEIPISALPGGIPATAKKTVTQGVKTEVQTPAVPEQTVPAAQAVTVGTTAKTAVKAETKVEAKVEPKIVETPVVQEIPVVQEVPVVQVAPVVQEKPQQVTNAANSALELLRGGTAKQAETTQPATAEAVKDDFSDLPFTIGPTYNNDMSIEQIVSVMTLEQAKAVVVDDGMSKGMTMGEVAEKRPASLKFYLSPGYRKNNNILRAAAQILDAQRQKAS